MREILWGRRKKVLRSAGLRHLLQAVLFYIIREWLNDFKIRCCAYLNHTTSSSTTTIYLPTGRECVKNYEGTRKNYHRWTLALAVYAKWSFTKTMEGTRYNCTYFTCTRRRNILWRNGRKSQLPLSNSWRWIENVKPAKQVHHIFASRSHSLFKLYLHLQIVVFIDESLSQRITNQHGWWPIRERKKYNTLI